LQPRHVEAGVGVGHLERVAVPERDEVAQAGAGGEHLTSAAELLLDVEHLDVQPNALARVRAGPPTSPLTSSTRIPAVMPARRASSSVAPLPRTWSWSIGARSSMVRASGSFPAARSALRIFSEVAATVVLAQRTVVSYGQSPLPFHLLALLRHVSVRATCGPRRSRLPVLKYGQWPPRSKTSNSEAGMISCMICAREGGEMKSSRQG
jgi:hypothetical protein